MGTTQDIPIFPLGTVLYPAGRLPLRIFEPRYVDMTKVCIRDGTPFGVTLIRAGYEVGRPAVPSGIGCTARIVEWKVPSPGLFSLVTQGVTPFRLLARRTQADGLIVGSVELLEPADPLPVPKRFVALAELLRKLVAELGAEHFPTPPRFDDCAWVAYRLAELMPVTPERKQTLLEEDDPLLRLVAVEQLVRELQQLE